MALYHAVRVLPGITHPLTPGNGRECKSEGISVRSYKCTLAFKNGEQEWNRTIGAHWAKC